MIDYDEGRWGISFLFKYRPSMLFKASAWSIPAAAFAGLLRHYSREEMELAAEFSAGGSLAPAFLAVCVLMLGALVTMRGNQAYVQWFTAVSLLQSARRDWLNAFSLLLSSCSSDIRKARQVEAFQHQLGRIVSLMYACSFANMTSTSSKQWDVLDIDAFGQESLEFLQNCGEYRELVLQQWLQRLVVEAEATGVMLTKPQMTIQVYGNLNKGFEKIVTARSQGAIPYPLPLAHLIMATLVVVTVLLPLACASTVESPFWAVVITFISLMFLWSLHYSVRVLELLYAAGQLHALPLQKLQQGLNDSLTALLQMRAQNVPVYSYKREKEMRLAIGSVNVETGLNARKGGATVTLDGAAPPNEQKLKEDVPAPDFQARPAHLPEDQAIAPGVLDAVLFQPPTGSDLPSVERPKSVEPSLDMRSWSRAKPAREEAYRGPEACKLGPGKQKLEAMIDPAAKELSLVELTMLMETHLSRIAVGLEALGAKPAAPWPWDANAKKSNHQM
eukprot:TRINITY_DN102098_c0_g1_i1.p1 TRINITY_DN102098_c0_g1~~TRINITY_DN102098_c0_g1_i1.p1  ORF type:complete len:503 (+),score=121.58 TRINITY_DN102098_c0_g1_i1:74-1582(+)